MNQLHNLTFRYRYVKRSQYSLCSFIGVCLQYELDPRHVALRNAGTTVLTAQFNPCNTPVTFLLYLYGV